MYNKLKYKFSEITKLYRSLGPIDDIQGSKELQIKTMMKYLNRLDKASLIYSFKCIERYRKVYKSVGTLTRINKSQRNEKLIKSNMETKVTLSLKDEYKDIANLKDDLKQLFIVAKVELLNDTTLEEYETS